MGNQLAVGGDPGAVGYILKVSKHPNFPDNIYTGPDPTGTSEVINLPQDTQSGVGVSQNPQIGEGEIRSSKECVGTITGRNAEGATPYNEKGLASQLWGFDIDSDAIRPVLISPPNGGHVPYKQPSLQFTWKPVDHAVEYVFTLYNRNADGSRGAISIQRAFPPHKNLTAGPMST